MAAAVVMPAVLADEVAASGRFRPLRGKIPFENKVLWPSQPPVSRPASIRTVHERNAKGNRGPGSVQALPRIRHSKIAWKCRRLGRAAMLAACKEQGGYREPRRWTAPKPCIRRRANSALSVRAFMPVWPRRCERNPIADFGFESFAKRATHASRCPISWRNSAVSISIMN